jgi:hypothetical protein
MVELNVPHREREAIKSVDVHRLQELVDQCLRDERSVALRDLQLEDCGLCISSKLRAYERSLADHAAARAAKKRATIEYSARLAGSDLVHAVHAMKQRVETEEQEDQVFQVDDRILPPVLPSERISVRVSYRWRRTVADDWTFGSITFLHDVDMRPDYSLPMTSRKPSRAKEAEARREKLQRAWEHLSGLALCAVKEYFRKGGPGDAIPPTFRVKPDSHSRGLNNSSADFWSEPDTAK